MRVLATIVLVLAVIQTAGWATSVEERGADEEARLLELERESHKRWQVRDRAYLGDLLSENYRLVVMNGTVEDRDIVLGKKKPKSMKKNGPRFRVQELRAEPKEVVIDGDTATVLGVIHLKATIGDRPVPNLLRSMSVFIRMAGSWKLFSRSMTPIRKPDQKGK